MEKYIQPIKKNISHLSAAGSKKAPLCYSKVKFVLKGLALVKITT